MHEESVTFGTNLYKLEHTILNIIGTFINIKSMQYVVGGLQCFNAHSCVVWLPFRLFALLKSIYQNRVCLRLKLQ